MRLWHTFWAGLIRSIEEPMHHVAHDLKFTHNFLFICVSPFSIGEMILRKILVHLHPKIKSTTAKYGRNLHQERLHCWSCNLPVRSKPSTSVWHRDWVMSLRGKAVSLIWQYRWNHRPPTMQTRGSSYQLQQISDFTDLCVFSLKILYRYTVYPAFRVKGVIVASFRWSEHWRLAKSISF